MIKQGDTITYRSLFGGIGKKAKVLTLTLTTLPKDKYGVEVPAVGIESVKANKVMFELDDGHWCYSSQVVLSS